MSVLQGKIALVTGAKGGLGSFVTKAFLAAGAKVVGVSPSIQADDFAHPEFMPTPADLSSSEAARSLAGAAVASFARIDALVHVMGGFAGGTRVDETGDGTFERMLDFNYRAAFFMARAVLPPMRMQGGGCILAVASRQAVEPAANVGAYSASKVAQVSVTRTIALESRDRNISADTVLPGTMDTPRKSRWRSPGRSLAIGAAIPGRALLVHLASDAGAQVTSAAIPICSKQM